MADKTERNPLILTAEQRQSLQAVAGSRTAPVREVKRARILLAYADRQPLQTIARMVGVSRPTIYKCIDKALAMGWEAGLKDLYHRPKDPVITPVAKAWVVSIACTKPVDLGLASKVWTHHALASYVRYHANDAGYPALGRAAKATVQRILSGQELMPHTVRYYRERRDPDFDRKMREVLLVCREVFLNPASLDPGTPVYTVSLDEKPGVQTPGLTASDRSSVPGKHPTVSRDPEYVRLGTASIWAALDLSTGHVIARVEERHRSQEFIALLQDLDAYYLSYARIRIILDNHSAHVSQETRAYLATRPTRFEYVHTPQHGAWLNLIETLFSKMTRTFLKHIRVASWAELKERIEKGIAEINANPVMHRWKNFNLEHESVAKNKMEPYGKIFRTPITESLWKNHDEERAL